jgi:hypothetical protein
MRAIVAVVFAMVCLTFLFVFPSTSGAQAGKAAVKACSLLTKEVVTQTSPYDKQALLQALQIPPMEDVLGPTGSACSYGGITMQVDPFTPAVFEKQKDKKWSALPGVGDSAYFNDNGGRWGELYVVSAGHVLTIQMAVPTGKTAASIQPNAIALAKSIIPKLK